MTYAVLDLSRPSFLPYCLAVVTVLLFLSVCPQLDCKLIENKIYSTEMGYIMPSLPPWNPYVEVLILVSQDMTPFGDKVFGEMVMSKWGQ